MDVNFHIPDFMNHLYLNLLLIKNMEQFPECYREGIKIASIFGNFCGSVWNGGRYLGGNTDPRAIQAIIKTLNDLGVHIRFTFTNPLLEKEHLGDQFSNGLLRIADNGMNEVIVMSPLLEEYIRKNYPNYKITSSTCKQIENMDDVKAELKKDYKYVVLDYNFNNKFEMLEQIPQEDRARCEILVNACCQPNCPRRGEHYRQIGREQIREWEHKRNKLNKIPYHAEEFRCDSMRRNLYGITGFSTHVSPDDIYEKYVPMGFVNFKIEGRTTPDTNLLETYMYYMVRPEMRDKTRLHLLNLLTAKHRFFTG